MWIGRNYILISAYIVYRMYPKVTFNRVHYRQPLSTPSLSGVHAARKLMLGSHSRAHWLFVYIYLGNLKELAQSCAVCHRSATISSPSSRYLVVGPSVLDKGARYPVANGYSSITLCQSSITWIPDGGDMRRKIVFSG